MITLERRKELIIKWVMENDDGINDFKKIIAERQDYKLIAKNDPTWQKHVEPLDKKTDVDKILLSQNVNYEAFEKACEEHKFFDNVPEDEFIRQIQEMS